MLELLTANLIYVLSGVVGAIVIYFFFFSSPSETTQTQNDNNASEDEEENSNKPKLLILFGSQTGTAEEYAGTIAQESKRFGFKPKVVDLVDYEPEELAEESLVMFVVATYGEGEPTDNARDFFDWISSPDREKGMFSKVKFCVFGLGNKQYKIYQAVARLFDKRMEELGGKRVFMAGEGDADGTLEEDFEDWKSQCLPALSQEFGTEISEEKIESKCILKFIDGPAGDRQKVPFDNPRRSFYDAKTPLRSKVLVNRQLLNTKEDRSTIHVEFDIKGSNMTYEAGDHLAVFPENEQSVVEAYAKRLGVEDKLETVFSLVSKDKKTHIFPKKCTVRTALTYYVYLTAVARKKFIKGLSIYAKDEQEKKELELLSSNSEEGKKAYHKEIKDLCLDPLDVLMKYKSVELPFGLFLELLPKLQPRYYSIASSSETHPDSIHAVVAVVTYEGSKGKKVKGICSNFLQQIEEGKSSYIYVRQSNFHLPENSYKPVILIGPGTGLAPFRGFIHQRQGLISKGKDVGKCYLYFGCRKKDEDFIYQDELTKAEKEGNITGLRIAFSRDQEKKVYVQHHIEEDADIIWDVISQSGGYLYICGDAKYMAKDVESTLIKIFMEKGNMSEKKANEFLNLLTEQSRYLRDVWSP